MEPYIVIPKPAASSCSWWVGTTREQFRERLVNREAERMRASQLTASADLGITTRLAYKHRDQEQPSSFVGDVNPPAPLRFPPSLTSGVSDDDYVVRTRCP